MTRKEKAMQKFLDGYNCSQCMILAFEDIVEKYNEYKKICHDIEDLEVLKHDKDEEMAEMAKMELEEVLPKQDFERRIKVKELMIK